MRSKIKFLILILTLLVMVFPTSSIIAQEIKIGGLTDCTGATSDVGKDYALGLVEAFNYVNDTGGINGKKIKYTWFDYGYRIPEAITKYNFLKRMGVIAIEGWGTGSAHLTNPVKTPYNLFFAPDYSVQARAVLTTWFETRWPKNKDFGKRKPRFACVYAFPSPYASAPIKAIKDHAAMLGFEIGDDQDVALTTMDTKSQIMALQKFKPDVCWHGNTTMCVSATVRDAYALGLGADWLVNYWGEDENLPKLAGKAAERAMVAGPAYFFADNRGKMKLVHDYAAKFNPGIPAKDRIKFTVTAWCNVLLLSEAMKRADKAGDLTGPGILQKGFETIKDYAILDGGLGTGPVTFTSTDHRTTGIVPVYELREGKFNYVKTIDVKTRWPEKWAKEWFGW
jgi:branched-chain amino acid transport system substrate-binding protein